IVERPPGAAIGDGADQATGGSSIPLTAGRSESGLALAWWRRVALDLQTLAASSERAGEDSGHPLLSSEHLLGLTHQGSDSALVQACGAMRQSSARCAAA